MNERTSERVSEWIVFLWCSLMTNVSWTSVSFQHPTSVYDAHQDLIEWIVHRLSHFSFNPFHCHRTKGWHYCCNCSRSEAFGGGTTHHVPHSQLNCWLAFHQIDKSICGTSFLAGKSIKMRTNPWDGAVYIYIFKWKQPWAAAIQFEIKEALLFLAVLEGVI